jgi:hypothetical protein
MLWRNSTASFSKASEPLASAIAAAARPGKRPLLREITGAADQRYGMPPHNGFANHVSLGSEAQAPTSTRARRLARKGRHRGFPRSTPLTVPNQGQVQPSFERPDRLLKRKGIPRDQPASQFHRAQGTLKSGLAERTVQRIE